MNENNSTKTQILELKKKTWHTKLVDKMCKYEMDLASMNVVNVEDTEWRVDMIWSTDRRTDGQTKWKQHPPPPLNFVGRGYNDPTGGDYLAFQAGESDVYFVAKLVNKPWEASCLIWGTWVMMCMGNRVKFAFILDNFDNAFFRWGNHNFIKQFLNYDHRSITPKFVTPTALSCIDNSWRSTTHESAEETYLFNS